ncbi:unnamed protein product [Somion occarium]|uniref:NADAR domain-containing protein n=1 Tax=Somion occarium TaxID=3059160 RepID=A0ABP1CWH9_9APHY
MGNSPSRTYGRPETVYPPTRPTAWPTHRKRSRGGMESRAWYPDDAQFYNPQQFYPTYAPPVTVAPIPFAPVVGQPGMPPVIPPMPIFQTTQSAPQHSAAHATMPAPQVASSTSDQPVFPPAPVLFPNATTPVIPQQSSYSSSQEPVDQPTRRSGSPYIQPGAPLAPGQYGPRDTYDDHSRTPSSDHHHHSHHHQRGRSDNIEYDRRHRNPLPSPPKDLFELSPYITLLRDLKLPPEESTLRKHAPAAPRSVLITPVVAHPQHQGSQSSRERKQRKGLFRSLSSRLAPKHREHHDSHYDRPMFFPSTAPPIVIPAPEGQRTPGGGMQYIYSAPLPGIPEPQQSMFSQSPRAPPAVIPNRTPSPTNRMPSPAPSHRAPRARTPAPQLSPPIKIDHENHLSGLVHYSPHTVHFNRKVYPTAHHLLEALKFMEHRPDVAERIRTCGGGPEGVDTASRIADEMRDFVRSDWDQVVVPTMEEVLYNKLIQHPDLRRFLMETGTSDLLYSSRDDFWGDGPLGQGANELGKALVRVRERLREEGYTADM